MPSQAEQYLAQFDPAALIPQFEAQGLSGQELGQQVSRFTNIGTVLRSLYERGGFTKGPEYFSSPEVLAQRAQMFAKSGRKHPLLPGQDFRGRDTGVGVDLLQALLGAQRSRNPSTEKPEPPPKEKRAGSTGPLSVSAIDKAGAEELEEYSSRHFSPEERAVSDEDIASGKFRRYKFRGPAALIFGLND